MARRGAALQGGSILAPHPAALGSIFPAFPPKKFRGKNMDVAEVNQQCWFEESGQWLEDVDGTHLVLAND